MTDGATSDDWILLKWGTLKGWHLTNPRCLEIVEKWIAIGVSLSAMAQHNTLEQTRLICDLIDAHSGSITNDWSGEELTQEEAKSYIMGYRA